MTEDINKTNGLTDKEYQTGAADISKSFILMFFVFCAYFAWYKDISIGLLWIPYLIVGMFLSSVIFAFLYAQITFITCYKMKYNTFVVFLLCYPFKWGCYAILFFTVKFSLKYLQNF